MPELQYYLLDVFSSEQFGGNALAVFPEADHVSTEQMQSIANELNLSETTFIQSAKNVNSDCTVRIFTPKSELPMAGHPTIGTAYAILKHRLTDAKNDDHLTFDEGIGPVRVDYEIIDKLPAQLRMHQPAPVFHETLSRDSAAKLLSLSIDDISSHSPVQVVSCGVPLILVPLTSLDAARRAKVRLDLVESELSHVDCREFFVFTTETTCGDTDVHCRMFAPRFGIAEDPATGSAHGPLAGYCFRYKILGTEFVSEQGVEMGRPSRIAVRVVVEGEQINEVLVGGECAEIGSGIIRLLESS